MRNKRIYYICTNFKYIRYSSTIIKKSTSILTRFLYWSHTSQSHPPSFYDSQTPSLEKNLYAYFISSTFYFHSKTATSISKVRYWSIWTNSIFSRPAKIWLFQKTKIYIFYVGHFQIISHFFLSTILNCWEILFKTYAWWCLATMSGTDRSSNLFLYGTFVHFTQFIVTCKRSFFWW